MKFVRSPLLWLLWIVVLWVVVALGVPFIKNKHFFGHSWTWEDVRRNAQDGDYQAIDDAIKNGRLKPVDLVQGVAPVSDARALTMLNQYAPLLHLPVEQAILIRCLILNKRRDAMELIRKLELSPNQEVSKSATAAREELEK
jgi:hypothetical protein